MVLSFFRLQWYPEIRSHCSTTPVVLCGCRADARSDVETILPITTEQAIKASQYITATAFAETSSSFVNQGVNEAFEVAAEAALDLLNENNCSPKKVSSAVLKIRSEALVIREKKNDFLFDFARTHRIFFREVKVRSQ